MNQKLRLQREIRWLMEEKYPRETAITPDIEKDIGRLKKGEPVDYVIGFSHFLGCKIDLSLRPMIPRSETEFWVEQTITEIKNSQPPTVAQGFGDVLPAFVRLGRTTAWRRKNNYQLPTTNYKLIKCLDIFSGSGCIGIAVLKHLKNARVDFSEKEGRPLKQIKINLQLNRIPAERWRIIKSDVFQNIRGKYNFIFANPPYVAKKRINKIQKSVLQYEPKKAIFGGKDGLLYIRRFLKEAKKHLKPGGIIFMEFDAPQKKEISETLKRLGYQHYEFRKDQYNKWRYLKITINNSRTFFGY